MTRTVDDRPLMPVWRNALTRRECATLHKAACRTDWAQEAIDHPMLISSGDLPLGSSKAFDPFRRFGKGFQGVACTEAQMHSDEHVALFRWNILGLVGCPAGDVRVTAVLDDLTVETGIVTIGDAFVLDIHRAHAAHTVGDHGLLCFWSVILPAIETREDAQALAAKLVRFIREARRGRVQS